MKLVTTILVAAFVVAASISFAFADCPGHTKAQLVKTDDPQIISDRAGHHRYFLSRPIMIKWLRK